MHISLAIKKREDNTTFAFIVDVKAHEHQIKQAVKKFNGMDVAMVSTLPDQA